jgi:glycosyltransferase involved in cell wall biosynthesis
MPWASTITIQEGSEVRLSVRVLVAHNRYQSALPSGENEVVDLEIAALRHAGVQVIPYIRSSDEIAAMGARDRFLLPFMPLHSRRATADIVALLDQDRPDVVHLHNPYPLISLSIVRAAHSHGVPVVQTVHNHRHSCARGSYFRDGHPCFECRGKDLPWPSVQHGCYRDSRLQSVALASALFTHRQDQRAIDKYIALSPAIAESLYESGLVGPNQVVVRPNCVPDPGPATAPGNGLLFVGRLSKEKGVPLLLDAWERSGGPFGTLTIVGDGPERSLVEERAAARGSMVIYLGPQQRDGVDKALISCAALVVPSTAPEALPLVVLEAFSHGRPVLASRTGGLSSVINKAVGWLTAPDAEELANAMQEAVNTDVMALGRGARATYERNFAPNVVVAQQIAIYENVVADHLREHVERQVPNSPEPGDMAPG